MTLQGRKVLLLNKSYEPLQLMPLKAVMKKLSKSNSSLEVLEWNDQNISTVKGEYPMPSVVRLTYYLDMVKRRNRSHAKRHNIYIRDKYRCGYCNVKIMDKTLLTLDHIIPRAQGGATSPENLVTACIPCNSKKGNNTPEQANMPLLTSKTLLKVHLDVFNVRQHTENNEKWKNYLFLGNGEGDKNLSHST